MRRVTDVRLKRAAVTEQLEASSTPFLPPPGAPSTHRVPEKITLLGRKRKPTCREGDLLGELQERCFICQFGSLRIIQLPPLIVHFLVYYAVSLRPHGLPLCVPMMAACWLF